MDFGFATKVKKPFSLKTRCGTPSYVAPEILKNKLYGTEVDNWSLGVILFIILCGRPPFKSPNRDRKQMFIKICDGDYEFQPEYWSTISKSSQDLVTRFLTVDQKERITAKEALKHEWIQQSAMAKFKELNP